MRILPKIILPVILLLSACSYSTSPNIEINRPQIFDNIKTPKLDIPLISEWRASHPIQISDSVSGGFMSLKEGISEKIEISKMPQIQQVMAVSGSHIAQGPKNRDQNFVHWDQNKKYEWTVLLPDARLFKVRQSGPQFYQYESLILIKSGLNLTLVHRPDHRSQMTVAPPDPY
jgi:hypothetical protein